MSNRKSERRGDERTAEKNLEESDLLAGRSKPIKGDIRSSNREEQRRAKFIDIHYDEDGDPDTSERDVYGKKDQKRTYHAPRGRGKLMRALKRKLGR